ncbi:MAG: anti-sigma factor ChrR (cupin superfamily) [Cryomorphaceae bacterium]|jgi:anti-sigma factor ChrR (cupin superfamily)
MMRINAEFDQRVVVHSADMPWVESPMPGVSRRPLDRVGDEVARATSIVRYAPGSHFSPHVHTGGEEFLVLDGVFQDDHGDFPMGSYIRNPPQSSHTPGSEQGCVIFVKLWQFQKSDSTHVRLNEQSIRPVTQSGKQGVEITPLYLDQHEEVSIQRWATNIEIEMHLPNGGECLVLSGEFKEAGDVLKENSWLRLPVNSTLRAKVGENGAKVWIKLGHLDKVDQEIARLPKAS